MRIGFDVATQHALSLKNNDNRTITVSYSLVAQEYLRKALELDPSNTEALSSLVTTLSCESVNA